MQNSLQELSIKIWCGINRHDITDGHFRTGPITAPGYRCRTQTLILNLFCYNPAAWQSKARHLHRQTARMPLLNSIDSRISEILPAQHKSVFYGLIFFLLLILLLPDARYEIRGDQRPLATNFTQQFTNAKFNELIKTNFAENAEFSKFGNESIADAPKETDSRLFLEVQPGDNLSLLFKRAGLDAQAVYMLANSGPDAAVLSNLHPGFKLAFEVTPDNSSLQSLEVFKSPLESDLFTLTEKNQYAYEHVNRTPEVRHVFKEAVINDSLFLAAQQRDIPAALTLELADIFGGVIDFILDTKKGDRFSIIYEEKYLEGTFIEDGDILAAQYINQGKVYTAVQYKDLNGDISFYNPDGESMRKAFLLNPVDFTRISSNFSLSRKHPILNTIRAHKGTDYAAPSGSPVVATADGKVIFSGRKGSFGNLLVITHGEHFETKYAHLKGYAKGIKEGVRVQQGQVIGYVGATGGATGPHLHYEFLVDGVHRNSRTIHESLPQAKSISKDEMSRFKEQTNQLISQLTRRSTADTELAHQLTAIPTE
jgi:murein DD-endopeptidase MepM/ murein hydrolase activator NlpD